MPILGTVQRRIEKMNALPKWLITKCKVCEDCPLAYVRRNVVVGKGESPADIMFIGEAPGKSEDILGEPFTGASGKLLDLIIDKAEDLSGLHAYNYFFTNTILCHPTNVKGGDNREPLPVEVSCCSQNIMRIYGQVQPKIVVFVGKVAQKYYKKEFTVNATILHPSFILRQGGQSSPLFLQTARILSEIMINLTKEG